MYFQRLKTLFWIAVFNFVFPIIFNVVLIVLIIFNVVLIVLVFRDHNFLEGSYIIYTNNYVEIIGVLLATIWATGTHDSSTKRLGYGQSKSLNLTEVVLPSGGSAGYLP